MSDARWRWVVLASLLAAVVLVYFQVEDHEFVILDDYLCIVENPLLRSGLTLESAARAFSSRYEANWIPLTWISLQVDFALHGLDPAGYHLTNVALHALCTLVLFLAMVRMTGSTWGSAFVAGVLAVHPLHVESVAWATERKDVLCGLFFSLTLWFYARYAERPGIGRYLPVAILAALALLAKPMAVTLPFVLLLLDFWPLGRLRTGCSGALFEWRRLGSALLEKIPLFALSAVSALVAYKVQQAAGAMDALGEMALALRVQNVAIAYATYVGMAFWPAGLSVFYSYPTSIPVAEWLAASGLALGLTIAAILQASQRPYLLTGWLWYLGMLVPVIGIVQVGGQSMADRYNYLPLIGLSMAVAWGARELVERVPRLRIAVAALAGSALVALGAAAWFQVQHWRDSVSLFEHAVRVNPTDRQARTNLGSALLDAGEVDLGVRELAAGFGLDPEDPRTRKRVLLIFVRQGNASYRAGSHAEAIVFYRSGLALAPDSASLHHLLARSLLAQGRAAEGWHHLVTARDLDPTIAAVHARIAEVLAGRGDGAGAVESYRAALRLEPTNPSHASALAVLLATHPDPAVRDPEAAVRTAEEALRSAKPAHLDLVDALAIAYAAAGRFHEAARTADRAIELAQARGLKDRARLVAARREQYRRGELEPVPSLPLHPWHTPGRRSPAR